MQYVIGYLCVFLFNPLTLCSANQYNPPFKYMGEWCIFIYFFGGGGCCLVGGVAGTVQGLRELGYNHEKKNVLEFSANRKILS